MIPTSSLSYSKISIPSYPEIQIQSQEHTLLSQQKPTSFPKQTHVIQQVETRNAFS